VRTARPIGFRVRAKEDARPGMTAPYSAGCMAGRDARRQLDELPDDFWTNANIEFYQEAPDAVFKALEE
jgi:hypothetical protein